METDTINPSTTLFANIFQNAGNMTAKSVEHISGIVTSSDEQIFKWLNIHK